jgi:hypothetical protein
MAEMDQKRNDMLQTMRQLAQDRMVLLNKSIKDNKDAETTTTTIKDIMSLEEQKEGLEREMNSLLFDWETFPKLIEEKAQRYLTHAQEITNRTDCDCHDDATTN